MDVVLLGWFGEETGQDGPYIVTHRSAPPCLDCSMSGDYCRQDSEGGKRFQKVLRVHSSSMQGLDGPHFHI